MLKLVENPRAFFVDVSFLINMSSFSLRRYKKTSRFSGCYVYFILSNKFLKQDTVDTSSILVNPALVSVVLN